MINKRFWFGKSVKRARRVSSLVCGTFLIKIGSGILEGKFAFSDYSSSEKSCFRVSRATTRVVFGSV